MAWIFHLSSSSSSSSKMSMVKVAKRERCTMPTICCIVWHRYDVLIRCLSSWLIGMMVHPTCIDWMYECSVLLLTSSYDQQYWLTFSSLFANHFSFDCFHSITLHSGFPKTIRRPRRSRSGTSILWQIRPHRSPDGISIQSSRRWDQDTPSHRTTDAVQSSVWTSSLFPPGG